MKIRSHINQRNRRRLSNLDYAIVKLTNSIRSVDELLWPDDVQELKERRKILAIKRSNLIKKLGDSL